MIIRVSAKSKRAATGQSGFAQAAAVRLPAERIGAAKSDVAITHGLASIRKTVHLEGMDAAEAVGRLGGRA